MEKTLIYWFRRDLRTRDLPGLAAAVATGKPIIPCYILDHESAGEQAMGSASRWWLHQSLAALATELAELGTRLIIRQGPAPAVLQQLITECNADAVYCSRVYEPWAGALEENLHTALDKLGVDFKRYAGSLLFEPGKVMNKSGTPCKVFTPFWRHCLQAPPPPIPQGLLNSPTWQVSALASDSLDSLELQPRSPNWAVDWHSLWQPGSIGAKNKLQSFLGKLIHNYSEGRDVPSANSTSRLSAHLHFGEISPYTVWHAATTLACENPGRASQVEKFLSELGWREFSHHLLHHFPQLPEKPFKHQFERFPWLGSAAALRSWESGNTGYPIVDAGMRELWQTGYMHNRVRMVAASFLTKHLLVDWRSGARWFRDTLVDADLANNSCSWQWVAGSGADASPYFRIFNPVLQGEKYDPAGHYVRQWLPELANLPNRYLHKPWEAPGDVLLSAGVTLGQTYPLPVVDHRAARQSALAAYAAIREPQPIN